MLTTLTNMMEGLEKKQGSQDNPATSHIVVDIGGEVLTHTRGVQEYTSSGLTMSLAAEPSRES